MAPQGPPPPRSGRAPAPSRRRDQRQEGRYSWGEGPNLNEEEYPPWAGMAVKPTWAGQEGRSGRAEDRPPDAGGEAAPEPGSGPGERGEAAPEPGSGERGEPAGPGFRRRAGAERARRARLKRYVWAGTAAVVAAIVAVVLTQLLGGSPPPRVAIPGVVTTFQRGELKTVPNACSAVPTATLSQAMQGSPASLAPQSLYGKSQSVCDWTVDAPPVYRHLEVTLQAYAPSGLATGNGSATNAAIDAYRQALQGKVKPPKGGLPKASVSQPGGLGQQAFGALQRVARGGATTYIETIVTRFRNVLVTVVLQGSHTGRRYGQVPVARLASGATAIAHDALSQLG